MARMTSRNDKNASQSSAKNPYIAERVGTFSSSVWEEVGRLSRQYECVSLLTGAPDFDPPDELKRAAKNAIDAGFNQYSFSGVELLRKAITEKLRWFNDIIVDPDVDITICCGSTEALTASMLAILNPGDEIILIEPFFPAYLSMARLAGAKPNFVTLHAPKVCLAPEELKQVFTKRPKAILLNSPHNPTGKVFSREELQLIADLCEDYGVLCLTDEIYEHFVYDDLKHMSIAALGTMTERTITVSGFSKFLSITGWRIGYTVASKPFSEAINRIHGHLTISAPHPLQVAIAEVLQGLSTSHFDQITQLYAHKRNLLLDILNRAGFVCLRPNGAFYISADVKRMGFDDNFEFVKQLIVNQRVACMPISGFFANTDLGKRYVRFSFCKKNKTLLEVGKRLEHVEFSK